jgi:hypothetical protein
MLSSVGEHSCSGDCVSLSLRVVGVVMICELLARKLFADAAVVNVSLIRACVDRTDSCSPERLTFQRTATYASRLFFSQIIRTMPAVSAAHR